MKHFLIVLGAALITIFIVLIIYRPGLLEGIWLWLVGLIGPIIGFGQEIYKRVSGLTEKKPINSNTTKQETHETTYLRQSS